MVSFKKCAFYTVMLMCSAGAVCAQDTSADTSPIEKFFSSDSYTLGGRLKNRMSVSWPEPDSYLNAVNSGTLWDYSGNLRFDLQYFLSTWGMIEAHNETIFLASETRRKLNQLRAGSSGIGAASGGSLTPDDRHRLLDMTMRMASDDTRILINRFDRLSLTLYPDWGVVRAGRQAITWGHGFLFNPMDIFTPFAPTQVDRDYKQGEDAASIQYNFTGHPGDIQLLYVPRRNETSHNVRFDESSLAANYHLSIPEHELEANVIGGYHYDDAIAGIGFVGYLGSAAWRIDGTWTHLNNAHYDFFSLVANMDYSWIWWGLNFYGWIEYYYSGIGEKPGSYEDSFTNRPLQERLARGELFVRGRHYVDVQVRAELHPLLNVYVTNIMNVGDPSGIIQPYIVWDFKQDIQIVGSATIFWGAGGTEYGGVALGETGYTDRSPTIFSAWVSYYF